ncbi:hypothetical protein LC612_33470 [Nostoc sp. CHAB 5834]|nr:hypothetical protein [Nostoc sp. CHAB 5834]
MFKKFSRFRRFIVFSSTLLALTLALVLIIAPMVKAQLPIVYEGSFVARAQTETRQVFRPISDAERLSQSHHFFVPSVTGRPVVPSFRVVVLEWKLQYFVNNDSDGYYELVVNNKGGNDLNVNYKIYELLF